MALFPQRTEHTLSFNTFFGNKIAKKFTDSSLQTRFGDDYINFRAFLYLTLEGSRKLSRTAYKNHEQRVDSTLFSLSVCSNVHLELSTVNRCGVEIMIRYFAIHEEKKYTIWRRSCKFQSL